MKVPVFSIKDRLIGFGTTFTATNKEVAIRGFQNSIKANIEGDIVDGSVSIEDLTLYMVGEFDCDNGVITSCEPTPICYGSAVLLQYHNSLDYNCPDSGGDSVNDKAL